MTGAKQILLAGFAALCMVLPACNSTSTHGENVESTPLVDSSAPLNTASYTADFSQDGALPFSCEVKLGTGGRIRRDYVWKDEKNAEKKVSIVIDGSKAVRIEDGKAAPVKDADAAQARFFAGLVLNPLETIVLSARNERISDGAAGNMYDVRLDGIPAMKSCIVEVDRNSRLWTALTVGSENGPGNVVSTFSEYKSESGVTYPTRIVSSTEGGAPVSCTIRDVKINPELPDELFRLPDTNG